MTLSCNRCKKDWTASNEDFMKNGNVYKCCKSCRKYLKSHNFWYSTKIYK